MDIYNHVKERFKHAGIALPYDSFHAPANMIRKAHNALKSLCDVYNYLEDNGNNPTNRKIGF